MSAPAIERVEEPVEPGAAPRRTGPPLEILVFAVGMSTLGAEIAAARLLAPFFGASTIVWANTIAVVLVALSIGYWFGGRMADRRPNPQSLCKLVLAAAVLLALVPWVSDPFLSASVAAFDSLSIGTFAGSLFGVLALVAVPVLMLGAVSPWAIRLKLHSIEDSGETAGRMYAISTVGSLLGTFLSALALIPLVGTTRTFLTFALVCTLAASLWLGWRYAFVPVLVAAAMAIPPGTTKAAEGYGKLVYETETTFQYARVIDFPDGERHLELNEGQAVHSIYRPETVLTGDYWDGYLVLPFTSLARAPRHIAVLGTAGGTAARAYAHYFPRTRIDAVEIDGELFDIAHKWFGLRERPQLREFAEDARPFLERSKERYDAIFVDCYRQPYIPFYLTTREFFELVHDRLAPGGSVIINVGHPVGSDELEKVLTATMKTSFESVVRDPIERTNTMLIAARDATPSADTIEQALTSGTLPVELAALARDAGRRLAPGLAGGRVFTDDKAPVEYLVDLSLLEYATE